MRARRWPIVGAACALALGAVTINPLPAGAVSTPAPKAAVFYNEHYVDVTEEAANVVTTLTDAGVTVSTFDGIEAADFTAALTGADVFVIPELEYPDDGGTDASAGLGDSLAEDMGPESRAVVKNWVDAGGRLIVFGGSDPWLDVDDIFGTNYEGGDSNNLCAGEQPSGGEVAAGLTGEPCVKQAIAASTEFAEGPDTLDGQSATRDDPINLPAGTKTIYVSPGGGEAAVTAIPQGHGAIVFLAWDWFNAYQDEELVDLPGGEAGVPSPGIDTGWFTVLQLATDATVAVNDVAVNEGTTASFTVSLPGGPVAQDVTVAYSTADGTAVAGTDYVSTSGTAYIPVGQTSVTVDVPTINRPGVQGARTFNLNIDAPYFAQVADPTGVGTINDLPEATTTTTTTSTIPPRPVAAVAVVARPAFTG